MNFRNLCLSMAVAALSANSFAMAQAKKHVIVLDNATDLKRVDEPIVIKREELAKLTAAIPAGLVPRLRAASGKKDAAIIPSQTDDLNNDKVWDELAFLVSFEPKQKLKLEVDFVKPEQLPTFKQRAHARLGLSPNRDGKFETVLNETRPADWKPQGMPLRYQLEGPGWESDKIAFRNYFDSRNGMDIFGKRTEEMIIHKIGVGQDYHKLQDWGMDVLKVGNSLGAGAIALVDNGKLNALGQTASAQYENVADGPIRAIIRLKYEGWNVGGNSYNVVQQISIFGGQYWYKNEVTLSGFTGEKTLATGIVNLKNPNPAIKATNNDSFVCLATHARQGENNDILGMGIIAPKKAFGEYGETAKQGEGVTNTYYLTLKAQANKPTAYYFIAGWEVDNPEFAKEQFFTNMIDHVADRLAQPIKISKAGGKK